MRRTIYRYHDAFGVDEDTGANYSRLAAARDRQYFETRRSSGPGRFVTRVPLRII
jgi:hypothetical protein